MELFVVDTLVRRRRYVEAGTKRKAESLAQAIIDGSVKSMEPPHDVDDSEILAGVYHIDALAEPEEDE